MSTPHQLCDEQPLNSQCVSSGAGPVQRSFDQRSLGNANILDSTCKVSPFKPNATRERTLPAPELTPIPLQDEDKHRFYVPTSNNVLPNRAVPRLVGRPQSTQSRPVALGPSTSRPIPLQTSQANVDFSAPSIPPDIDIPSPPSLSSSDERETENDTGEPKNPQQPLVHAQNRLSGHRSPKTDTCDPPEFSQDSAFFSFSNTQGAFKGDHLEDILPSQESIQSLLVEQDAPAEPQAQKRYYTRAFDYVIAEVLKRYRNILPSQDFDTASIFRDNLSGNAQALFVRIYGRKQPQWYRVLKLEQAYASEIDVRAGIDELCREHFLISSVYALRGSPKAASLVARELLSTLDLSELRSACASIVEGSALRRLPRNRLLPALRKLLSKSTSSKLSKKRLKQTTLSGLRPAECLARAVLKLAGHSVRVPDFILSALRRMRFLFFLDDGHDSPNVILADTGKITFPAYKCQPRRTVFPSSQALQDYECAVELEQWIDEALEEKDWARAAYFGSIAELEVREFFNCCERTEGEQLSGPADGQARRDRGSSSLEKCISSRRPVLKKRINREEQLEQLSHPFLRRYTAQWVFVRCCWHSVHALERLSEYESAVSRLKLLLSTNLMPKRRGKCLTRLTINLFRHLGELEEPLRIIVSALNSSECHLQLGDQIGLAQRGAAIHAKLLSKNVPGENRGLTESDTGRPHVIMEALKVAATKVSVRKIFGKSLNVQNKEEKDRILSIEDPWLRYVEKNRKGPQLERLGTNLPIMGKSVFMSHRRDGGRVSVEEYCLEWYSAKESLTGAHDEGKCVRFLFTLLLWECALFAEVPDVFQTPYQDRPLDLYTEAFYPSRKESIEVRLEEIVRMSPEEVYAETLGRYERFEGTKAVGCMWTSHSSEDISSIAAGLGGQALAHCCRLLAKDYTYWGGGLPDLTLWTVDDGSSPKFYKTKLVEVKSARDNLCERQRAWLMELQSCGVECEVCKVVEKVTARNAREIEDTTLAPVAFNDLDAKPQAERS